MYSTSNGPSAATQQLPQPGLPTYGRCVWCCLLENEAPHGNCSRVALTGNCSSLSIHLPRWAAAFVLNRVEGAEWTDRGGLQWLTQITASEPRKTSRGGEEPSPALLVEKLAERILSDVFFSFFSLLPACQLTHFLLIHRQHGELWRERGREWEGEGMDGERKKVCFGIKRCSSRRLEGIH